MQEQLISFKTAKLAKVKEFGYDFGGTHYVPGFYCDEESDKDPEEFEMQQEDACRCDYHLRPTQSLLQKWLREVHNINLNIRMWHSSENIYEYVLQYNKDNKNITVFGGDSNNYEQTLEIGLQKALKLIK